MKMEGKKLKWPLVGNEHITEYLEQCIAHNNIGGSYIFYGPPDLGKSTAAVYFAQTLLCQNYDKEGTELPCRTCPSCRYFSGKKNAEENAVSTGETHGDCHIIRKEDDKKNISVELVREFIRILGLSSFLGEHKVGIIRDAECLSLEASNALLKTLEEPKRKVVIILVTSYLDALPQTIVSRSQILRFHPVKTDIIYDYLISAHKASRGEAKKFSRLSLGRPALAVKFLEDEEWRERYRKRVEVFLKFFRQDINERFAAVEDLIGKKAAGMEAAGTVASILSAWQGVIRDFMLIQLGFNNLTRNEDRSGEYIALRSIVTRDKIINLNRVIGRGEEYLRANVNPKLVLEDIAVSI
ncbi:hypothetical protein A2227_02705 [Candidatus Falkowbacteria bacterium RIFOXYA2_FULL_47_19]|uniref:DNA polymerase III subunit delta n=1 Tax=Candidatus Falkowbacteria bacterium RIFOXYA2_FULL_47_19 TaxID=1797994 RepID=A0A1F5SHG6_9BACT|nr:MAG: hypothetical protein A2227_02705 [Candidatus Falkowbacteria bacterium RIFOXYA2_FULL_47_19]